MRFRCLDKDQAEGFADGLAAPDELDVYASIEGNVIEILGVDDHPVIAPEIRRMATNMGAVELKD